MQGGMPGRKGRIRTFETENDVKDGKSPNDHISITGASSHFKKSRRKVKKGIEKVLTGGAWDDIIAKRSAGAEERTES